MDVDSPFYLEIEVDDEITFKQEATETNGYHRQEWSDENAKVDLNVNTHHITEEIVKQTSSSIATKSTEEESVVEVVVVEESIPSTSAPIENEVETKESFGAIMQPITSLVEAPVEEEAVVEVAVEENLPSAPTQVEDVVEKSNSAVQSITESEDTFVEEEAVVEVVVEESLPIAPVTSDEINCIPVPSSPVGYTSSLPLSLISMYENDEHLPKYSQAEFDRLVADAVAAAQSATSIMHSAYQEKEELEVKLKSAESKLTSLERQNVDLEDKLKLLTSKSSIQEEELSLHKTQSRALSHRLQALETELSQLKSSQSDSLQQYMAAREREIANIRSQNVVERDELIASHKSQMQDQFTAINAQHKIAITDLQDQIALFPKKLAEAVADAKGKVYEKVKAQFENGNREFQKVKQALKDSQTDAEAKANEIVQLKQNVSQQSGLLQSARDECTQVSSKLKQAHTVLMEITRAFGVSPSNTATPLPHEKIIELSGEALTATKKLQNEFAESMANLATVRVSITTLEASLKLAEGNVLSLSTRAMSQEDRAKVAEALLSATRGEMEEIRKDRDQQMVAVAKLASSQAVLEDAVGQLKTDLIAKEERCNSLRAMNEELLSMMESSVPN